MHFGTRPSDAQLSEAPEGTDSSVTLVPGGHTSYSA